MLTDRRASESKKPVLTDNRNQNKKPVLTDNKSSEKKSISADSRNDKKPVLTDNKPHHNNNKQETRKQEYPSFFAEDEKKSGRKTPVRIMSLGGVNEIGKNIYVYECCNDIFIIDCGLAFPDDDMLGVDLVIPDFTYLEKNREKIRGIVLTHGHEDHIGALPYFLKKINVPVYGTRLTLGLVEGKLREHGILSQCSLNVVVPRQNLSLIHI